MSGRGQRVVAYMGDEITGICQTSDRRTLFVNIQHPGEGSATTPATPTAVSNWPDYDPAGRPRSATIVITRDDGGVIGRRHAQ